MTLPLLALQKARAFAIKKHAGQRYGHKPYAEHLQDVENVLIRFGVRDLPLDTCLVLLSAAWLHDILEDTDTSRDDLESKFWSDVANLVWAVTNEDGCNRAERHVKTYHKIRTHGVNAVTLKLADRIANTEACIETNDSRLRMYRKEFPGFSTALFKSGECEEMWAYLRGLST